MEVLPTGDLKLHTLPHSQELEERVLGVLMLEQNSIFQVLEKIKPDIFFNQTNKTIFSAILALFREGNSTDMVSVADRLNRGNLGQKNEFYLPLMKMTNGVTTSAYLEAWVDQLVSDYVRRELAQRAARIYYSCFDLEMDSQKLIGDSVESVSRILQESNQGKERTFEQVLVETLSDMRKAADTPGGTIGLKTNFDFIDRNILGLVPPDLTIIAARPGQGKTTLALNIALNLAKSGTPVGFFSLEMKDRQLMWKILSNLLPDTVNKIRSGKISQEGWDKIGNEFDSLKNLPFHINDRGFLTTTEMKAIVKTWVGKNGVKAVFIDYLQLISGDRKNFNREAQVSANCRDIKALAMECDIPIILLSQLSRQGAGVEPELHHLRESGAIEQDADNILFINSDENETQLNYPGWIEGDPEWIVDVMLKKCRLGNKSSRKLILNAAHNKFEEIRTNFVKIEPKGIF